MHGGKRGLIWLQLRPIENPWEGEGTPGRDMVLWLCRKKQWRTSYMSLREILRSTPLRTLPDDLANSRIMSLSSKWPIVPERYHNGKPEDYQTRDLDRSLHIAEFNQPHQLTNRGLRLTLQLPRGRTDLPEWIGEFKSLETLVPSFSPSFPAPHSYITIDYRFNTYFSVLQL